MCGIDNYDDDDIWLCGDDDDDNDGDDDNSYFNITNNQYTTTTNLIIDVAAGDLRSHNQYRKHKDIQSFFAQEQPIIIRSTFLARYPPQAYVTENRRIMAGSQQGRRKRGTLAIKLM